VGLVGTLIDLVASELLADAAAREAAVLGAQLDAAPVFLQDALKVGTLDPAGELGGDVRQRAVVVKIEGERLVVTGDDLRGQSWTPDAGG
jgi:hypothetical protein